MLELKDIVKRYETGDNVVNALAGVSLCFRESEFVSILGASGCGKTTLLNIVGGLDRYTQGDLVINGRSTRFFKDSDWDTYRNHSVGFVFQSYNLIPHQTVLANVELALTLSGVSKSERKARAIEALSKVGLGDQLHKKPNQMSGGQMQRVAIARALVNDPDILLADEPTGALDTQTSVQIMELLKEVAKDRLVIMVTHNPELAEQYSTRIVKLSDGLVIDDSNPITAEEYYALKEKDEAAIIEAKKDKKAKKKTEKNKSMSFGTAISLSMKNLMTKKGRTIMTSFAGSIGIIGIALILAVSTGVTGFINDVQRDTLSSFPISIYDEEADLSQMMSSMMEAGESSGNSENKDDAVYSNPILFDLIHSMTSAEVKTNNLKPFKEWLDDRNNNELGEYVSGVHYTYDIDLNMYVKDPNGEYTKADIGALFSDLMGNSSSSSSMMSMSSSFGAYDVWCEMIPGEPSSNKEDQALISDMIYDQYELVDGDWPTKKNEILLVLNSNNEISDMALYTLGFITKDEMLDTIMSAMRGDDDYTSETKRLEFSEIIGKNYKLILNDAYYNYNKDTGLWDNVSDKSEIMKLRIENGYDVTISGIIKPKPEASSTVLSGTLAYTSALTDHVITETLNTELAKAQLSEKNSNFNVFTGLPFVDENKDDMSNEEKLQALKDYLAEATPAEKAELYLNIMTTPDDEYVSSTLAQYKEQFFGEGELTSEEKRAKLAELLSQQSELEGLDYESILSLIDAYTDEELEEMLDGYLTQIIITGYRDRETAKIKAEASAPSAEKLAELKGMIKGEITSKFPSNPFVSTELMYVAYMYSQQTGLPAESLITTLTSLGAEDINARFDALITQQAIAIYESTAKPTDDEINANIALMLDSYIEASDNEHLLSIYNDHMPDGLSQNTYEDNLKLIGIADLDTPSEVHIYATTFEAKDEIAALIDGYNNAEGRAEEDKITYTDYVAILMSSVTTIINAISYVLIAFVAISLVVSSVMIGIITNISVLERTKEIGILRAIGASKRDISRVFNAETFIIGLAAGLFGIIATIILCFPINAIIQALTGLSNITAVLPWAAAIILVIISMGLTMIAGLIPSRKASKKDPVVALRTE